PHQYSFRGKKETYPFGPNLSTNLLIFFLYYSTCIWIFITKNGCDISIVTTIDVVIILVLILIIVALNPIVKMRVRRRWRSYVLIFCHIRRRLVRVVAMCHIDLGWGYRYRYRCRCLLRMSMAIMSTGWG
ncbi:hypothetical protein PanWU01x14_141740, partial [Parasponia andersonii]